MTGAVGLIEFLIGPQNLLWTPSSLPAGTSGRRRRKYGTKQRTSAAGGREMNLELSDGNTWRVRVAGADLDFLDFVLAKTTPGKVKQAYTARGTIYGPQYT
jgi:hypothetical protein